jgi:hypothetical protein
MIIEVNIMDTMRMALMSITAMSVMISLTMAPEKKKTKWTSKTITLKTMKRRTGRTTSKKKVEMISKRKTVVVVATTV